MSRDSSGWSRSRAKRFSPQHQPEWGESPAETRARHYRILPERGRGEFLHGLIVPAACLRQAAGWTGGEGQGVGLHPPDARPYRSDIVQVGSALGRERVTAAVPHGFRSSFRDWASERTDHPREVVEAALAHVVRNQVEAACARSDLFERRRPLMDDCMHCLSGAAQDIGSTGEETS